MTKLRLIRNLFGEEVTGTALNATEPFYQLYGAVQVEIVPGSGVYTQTIEYLMDPLVDLTNTFVLNAGFRGHFIDPDINPFTISTMSKVTYNILRGKFFSGEFFGAVPEPVGVTEVEDFVLLKGGIANSVGFNIGLTRLLENQRFLSFAPRTRLVSRNQPIILHYLVSQAGLTFLRLKVLVVYDDGTEDTIFPMSLYVSQWDLIRIPVGYDLLNLDTLSTSKLITQYTVWLDDGADTLVSEPITYEVDYDIIDWQRLWMYENSLGMPEVFRTIGKTTYGSDIRTTEAKRALTLTPNDGKSQYFTNQATSRSRQEVSTGFLRDLATARYMLDFLIQKGVIYELRDENTFPVKVASPSIHEESTDGEYNYYLRFTVMGGFDNESYT